MSEVTLAAEIGRTTGTRPSRRLRAEGRVPGVVYGGGKEAETITFRRADLRHALNTEAGRNALVRLEFEGQSFLTLVREIQRHPVRRDVTHVDFLKVDETKPVELDIPVVLVGEAKQVTVMGGMTEQRLNSVRVRVRPDNIPNAIEVDISEMRLDRSILVKDLQMPEGAISLSKPQQAVVTAELTRAAVTTKAEDEEATTEAAEPAE
ncbi:MAG: 50S ribosomal protein L25 [Microthrixaceae bacterium]